MIRIDPGNNSSVTVASLGGPAGGATLLFQTNADGTGATFGSATNKFITTAVPTLTNGIIQRAIVFDSTGGTPTYNFATGAAATSISAYTGYNTTTNIAGAANTDNVRLTSAASFAIPRTLNSLTSNGAGITLGTTGNQTLTLTSGNILVQSGDLSINSGVQIAAGGTEIGLNVAPGATLNVNAPFTSSNNITVGLGGTVNFNTRQFSNTGANYLTINGGTVKLAGGDGTLFAGQTTGANQQLAISAGATLDLNGTVQVAGDLRSPNNNAIFGSGGVVTSTGGAATLVSRQANANWGGVISGPVTFVMANNANGNVERFYQDNTYTGRTLVTGGTIELTDFGRLSGTTAIDLQYGTLNILNTSGNNGRMNLTDRIPDATPINLSGGAIFFGGRAQTASTETLGTVTLVKGNSQINLSAGGVGINSSELTITNLVQGNIDAVTNVQGATGQVGSTTRIFIGNGPALLSNNILPVWFESGATEFMSYNSAVGAMPLSAVGAPGYTGTTLPTADSAATAVGNYRIGASGVVPAGGLTVNTLNINGAFNVTFGTTTSTDVLNIGANGLMKTGATGTSIGSVVDEGRLTAGGATPSGTEPLYVFNGVNGTSFTINSRIVDNGASPVRLIVNNYNGGTTALTNPNNSYTGGTVLNGWINNTGGGLTVTGTGLIPAGGVTINGSNLITTAAGQIAPTNTVTLGATSVLTLVGNNTLDSLVFDNYGGIGNAAVNTGGVLTLTGTVSASSSNVNTLPVINGTLDFAGAAKTFTINPISYNGANLNRLQPTLNIGGVIQNAGKITIAGGGLLQLTGQSTFSGGIDLTAGSGIALNGNSTHLGTGFSGPLGTGTLTTSSGTYITGTSASTVYNALNILGNLNFDGLNNVTFGGTTTLPGGAITLDIAAPQQTVSLVGNIVNPTTNITKTGYGTLVLDTSYAGTLTVPGGTIGFQDDGNGNDVPQNITTSATVNSTGALTVSVGRSGVGNLPYFTQALNKTIQIGSISTGGTQLSVTNNNQYGLDITGAVALGADQTYSVATATASNLVQGLTLSGAVSGAGGIVKIGAGTLALTNGGNAFGGVGKLVDIQGGVLSVPSDAALGDSNNTVRLNVAGTANVGFRATGTFSTGRTFAVNQATNAIEVSAGNTLTLTNGISGLTGTTQIVKNDAGTLELAAANAGTWTGSITAAGAAAQVLTGGLLVNQGVVKISNAAALGAATNIAAVNVTTGAGIQIAGGINVPNPLVLNTLTTNGYAGGFNWRGQLQSIGSGVTNTWSGPISMNQDAGVSADAGNTLNLTGGLNFNAHILVFNGEGNINVTTNPITLIHSLDKIGTGTTNIQVATAAPTGNGIRIFGGNLTFSGAGAVSGAGTLLTSILPGGTLNLDNSGTVTPNHLGGRVMTLSGGNLNLIGGASSVTEAIGAPTFARGQSIITVDPAVGGANLTFTAAANNPGTAQNNATAPSGATVLFRGTGLGSAAGAGVATIQGTTGGFTFVGQTGALNTTNKGILPWALVDSSITGVGTSFATADTATSVLRALNAGEYGTGATLVANSNQLITSAITGATTTNLNSITFDTGGSLAMSGTGIQTLTLSSGGILVRDTVSASLSGGILSAPAASVPITIHTPGTAALDVNTLFTGGNGSAPGLIKGGAGALTFSSPTSSFGSLNGLSMNTINLQTVVNQGTLVIGANNVLGNNTYLEVGAGGTLDLNGKTVYALGLFTDGSFTGIDGVTAGGTVTSSTGGTLVTNSDARNWAAPSAAMSSTTAPAR